MTPLQVLGAAVNGQPAPRFPVFCNLFDQGARELGVPLRDYYARGDLVAEAQLRMRAKYGHDNVWCLFYVGREAEYFGCREILFPESGSPNVAEFVIQSLDDIERLQVPDDLTAHPVWAQTGRCLSVLRREVGDTHPICAYLTASNSLPPLLMGMERWMDLLISGPADLRDLLLEKCSDFFRKELAAVRAAGANVVVYSAPFGSTSFVGRKRFEAWSLPWMARDLAGADRAGLVYYCGMAPFYDVIPDVFDQLGITVHYASPMDDLTQVKRVVHDRIAAHGGVGLTCGVIDDIRMARWTPNETRQEVRRICEIGRPGGHFLFGTGVMPSNIPEANIHAMVDTALALGPAP